MLPENYLSERADFHTHQYALVDRVLFEKLPDTFPAIELVTPLTAPQAKLYPWLIPLREMSGSQWRDLISDIQRANDSAEMPMICLFLKSELPPAVIKNSLLSMMIMLDDHKRRHILRFYDPRVLFHIHWMLSSWEFRSRFNTREIPCWTFWLEGKWHSLAFEQTLPFDTSISNFSFEKIQRINLINKVMAELPQGNNISARQEMSRRVDSLLKECPLQSDVDKIAFATQGAIFGGGFWNAGEIKALLNESRNEPGYYSRITSSWNDTDWQEILNKDNHCT